ncbi:MAG: hypothetical protein P8X63_05980 [Desulfuromonadaceae bacterium]|jgi:flagellar biosynthesis/type III secretory pathway chaperone
MASRALQNQLIRLHELILLERQHAKSFSMEELLTTTKEKETLLQQLESVSEAGPEIRALAETIKRENRRNAYLFWSTLKFVRESISFFNRQVTQTSYGAGGTLINRGSSGMVLAGRV